MPLIVGDTKWARVPRDPKLKVRADEIGVERYVRLIKFASAPTLDEVGQVCRQLEREQCPGNRVDGDLLFGINSTPVEYRFTTVHIPHNGPSMLHLITVLPSGMSLLFEVSLTGNIDMCAGGHTIASIEVMIHAACSRLRGDGPQELDGHFIGSKRLWVRPDDLCYNGTPFKHEELVEDAARVRERARELMARGPLPENWP